MLAGKVPDIACLVQLLRSFWHWMAALALRASLAVYEFLRNVCSPSEPPLHFLKAEVKPQHGEWLHPPVHSVEQGVLLSMPEMCSGAGANRARLCLCCNMSSILVQT